MLLLCSRVDLYMCLEEINLSATVAVFFFLFSIRSLQSFYEYNSVKVDDDYIYINVYAMTTAAAAVVYCP